MRLTASPWRSPLSTMLKGPLLLLVGPALLLLWLGRERTPAPAGAGARGAA